MGGTSKLSSGMRAAKPATPSSMALRRRGTPLKIRLMALTAWLLVLASACKIRPAGTQWGYVQGAEDALRDTEKCWASIASHCS